MLISLCKLPYPTHRRDIKNMKKPLERQIHLRINSDQKLLLDEVAEEHSTSPSQIVRSLIHQNLHNMKRNRLFT